MKYKTIKMLLPSILLICVLSLATIYADGAQSSLEEAGEQIENLENQIEDAKDELDQFNEQENALQNDLKNLNGNLQTLADNINKVESQITEQQEELEVVSSELDEATKLAEKQYEDMKLRIQFMYEQGNTSLLVTLLESKSFSDFLNKAEYVSQITSYDRGKLNEYQQLQTDIAQKQKELKEGEASLLSMKNKLKNNQSQVAVLINQTTENISQTQNDIANANTTLGNLEDKLKYWEELEKKLEEQKAKEDMEKWKELQNLGKEDWSNVDYTPQDGEAYLLAALIQCEAGGEAYEGKIAVGNVVLNRVKSSRFPNTITGVIYQKSQFSPAASGRLAYRLEAGVSADCIRAANEVLNGKYILDALFFRRNNGTIQGTVIGNHVFY